jgi:hypothetical protein
MSDSLQRSEISLAKAVPQLPDSSGSRCRLKEVLSARNESHASKTISLVYYLLSKILNKKSLGRISTEAFQYIWTQRLALRLELCDQKFLV